MDGQEQVNLDFTAIMIDQDALNQLTQAIRTNQATPVSNLQNNQQMAIQQQLQQLATLLQSQQKEAGKATIDQKLACVRPPTV